MDIYVTKQTVYDQKHAIIGCEIRYANIDAKSDVDNSGIVYHLMSQNAFTENKLLFVTMTREMLRNNIPLSFSPEKLVIQITSDLLQNAQSHSLVNKYRNMGYKIAIANFTFTSEYFGVLDIVDYVKISMKNYMDKSLENVVRMAKSFGKSIIAYDIECAESYERAKIFGAVLYEGKYVSQKSPVRLKKGSRIRSVGILSQNFIDIADELISGKANIDKIEELILNDENMTNAILLVANSPYFSPNIPIDTIKGALSQIGLSQLKQWIYLLAISENDTLSTRELIKLALIRALFTAEMYDFCDDMTSSRANAYMLGLLSLSGQLAGKNIAETLRPFNIGEENFSAIVNHKGRLGTLLELVDSYEWALWFKVTTQADRLGIPKDVIADKYCESVERINKLFKELAI